MSYATDFPIAAHAAESERAGFIRRTYGHLAGAILGFAALEAALLQIPGIENFIMGIQSAWIVLMIVFIGAGYLAQYWAQADSSPGMQYLGLSLYVAVEAVIFLPMLYVITNILHKPDIIATAGIFTLAIFAGLTVTVFLTRNDYSYLRPVLSIAGFMAMGLVICAVLFGLNLGVWFSFAMVGLASAYILYDTSNVLHHYRTDQHVGAALALFSSVALMFYYILRILMASSRD